MAARGGSKTRGLAAIRSAASADADFFTRAEAVFALWDMQVRERDFADALTTATFCSSTSPTTKTSHGSSTSGGWTRPRCCRFDQAMNHQVSVADRAGAEVIGFFGFCRIGCGLRRAGHRRSRQTALRTAGSCPARLSVRLSLVPPICWRGRDWRRYPVDAYPRVAERFRAEGWPAWRWRPRGSGWAPWSAPRPSASPARWRSGSPRSTR